MGGEEVYHIPDIFGLQRIILSGIISHKHGMSGRELRFVRTELGLTQAELAQHVKKDSQTIGRWERGETEMDQNAEAIIRLMAMEKLVEDINLSIEDILRRCVPSAKTQPIRIRYQEGAENPYQLVA